MDANQSASQNAGQNNDDLIAKMKQDRAALGDKFDDEVSYKDLVEKDILELMGFSKITEEKKKELHQKIGEMLEVRVAGRILDLLSEPDQKAYEELINAGKNDEALKFLNDRKIYPEELIISESMLMKTELYLDSKEIKKRAKKEVDEAIKKEDVNASEQS